VVFDAASGTIPNEGGRVEPGIYVAGWIKRGPTGVIGTNKSDATETVRSLLSDLLGDEAVDVPLARPGMLRYPARDGEPARAALEDLLARKGIRPVSYAQWLRVEAAETDLARALGRGDRVKLHGRDELYAACWPDPPDAEALEAKALEADAQRPG
jgi:ferredoxin--NADP+ reductase